MTRLRFGRFVVDLTEEDKPLFPGDGITKGALIAYYRTIAPFILPHTGDRPIVMECFPDGIDEEGVRHEVAPENLPSWIRTVTARKEGANVRHVLANDGATLVYLANQACITPHCWLSRRDALHVPDQLVFDLDPPHGGGFAALCRAALKLRSLCDELHLPSFVRTTGSRGLHVLVPLDRSRTFARVRDLARDMAAVLVARDSAGLTIDPRERERDGRVWLNTERNAYARTAAPAYAVRARPGAPIAMPLAWSELDDPGLHARRYHLGNALERVQHAPDPWLPLRRRAIALADARARLDRIMRVEGCPQRRATDA
jgi:bifunctional non-homologous end joining protein LigD